MVFKKMTVKELIEQMRKELQNESKPRKKKVAPEVELEKRIKSHEEKRIEEMKERQKAFRDERRKW